MSCPPERAGIGARVRAERQRRNLTVRALAGAVGVSPGMISQMELGHARPSVSTLYTVVSVLGAIEREDSPMGPQRLDEYNNPVYELYHRRVERDEEGQLVNVVVDTVEDVSQFWTYGAEEFLATPVYSREYQGQAG